MWTNIADLGDQNSRGDKGLAHVAGDASPTDHIANIESNCAVGSHHCFRASVSKIKSDGPTGAGKMVRTEKE